MKQKENSAIVPIKKSSDSYYDLSAKKKRRKKKKFKDEPYLVQADFIYNYMNADTVRKQRCVESYYPPFEMVLSRRIYGFMLGYDLQGNLIGKPLDKDGHIAVFGGSGTGKTTSIAIPNFFTWHGRIFALDFKGDLVQAAKKRHAIILHLNEDTSGQFYYDPFNSLRVGGENNLVANARALSFAIIPLPSDTNDPFWVQAAREILTGALIYYFNLGANFIDAMITIKSQSLVELIKKITSDDLAKICVTQDLLYNEKTVGGISMELHNHIAVFATDLSVQNFLSTNEEDDKCALSWKDLEKNDVVVRIDQRRTEQWSPVVRVVVTQLIDTLQTRPEKYSQEGLNIPPILLMLDEFPQLGKIEVITSALRTIRSKNVTIALFCQSLSDLDEVYGAKTRRTILDNCPYKAILSAYDAETQRYFADLVGTILIPKAGGSASFDSDGYPIGYSISTTESRDYIIQPSEFSSLSEIILVHPNYGGFCRLEKFKNFQTENEEEE